MFETNGLNHITIFVRNIKQSLDFYKDILRMKVVHDGGHYAYLESGTTWICLSADEIKQERPRRLEQLHLALTVDDADFDRAVQHLRDHNVEIVRGPVTRGAGRTVNFLDPDGMEWEFHTSSLAERMGVIAEMERDTPRQFDRYAFADYSGSSSRQLQKKHIVLSVWGEKPEHHTREELFQRICELLVKATEDGERVVFGFDHSYSFPQGFLEKVTGEQPTHWEQVTDMFDGAVEDARDWAEEVNVFFQFVHGVQDGGPFWGPNFKLQGVRPPFPYAALGMSERRLVEERCRKMKPIYQIGGAGSVGLQAIYGISYLARLRAFCRERDIPLFAWPFDGWELPETGHVLVEVYPTLFNQGKRSDVEDAKACTRWLYEQDANGTLERYFHPKLTEAERKRAQLEGWVLGI